MPDTTHPLYRFQRREEIQRQQHAAAAAGIDALGRRIWMRDGQYHNTARTVRALLFHSKLLQSRFVSVPVRQGCNFNASAHECEYEVWVPGCPPLSQSWDPLGRMQPGCLPFRVRKGCTADSSPSSPDCYVAFYVPQLLARLLNLGKNSALRVPNLRGNVLIMRMSSNLPDAFAVDVHVEDGLQVLPQKVFNILHPATARREHGLAQVPLLPHPNNFDRVISPIIVAYIERNTKVSTDARSTPAFNAQAVHDQYMARDDYWAVPEYRTFLTWVDDASAGNADMLAYKDEIPPDAYPSPAVVTAVGILTQDRPYLKATGTRNEKFNKSLADAKMQFTVGGAHELSPVLGEDWDRGVEHLEAAQNQVAATAKKNYFFVTYRGKKCIRINWRMFSQREGAFDPNDQDDKTTTWPAPSVELDALKETHRLNPVPFFDIDNTPMDPAGLLTNLVGAVVEVSFTLHHFAVKDSSGKPTSDTFTGRLVQLRVLRKASAQPASPYHSSLRTGSPYIPPPSPTRRRTKASATPPRRPSPAGAAVQQPEATASTVPPTTAPVPDQADDSSDRSATFSAPDPADVQDEDQPDEAAGDGRAKRAREGDTVAGKAGKTRRTGP